MTAYLVILKNCHNYGNVLAFLTIAITELNSPLESRMNFKNINILGRITDWTWSFMDVKQICKSLMKAFRIILPWRSRGYPEMTCHKGPPMAHNGPQGSQSASALCHLTRPKLDVLSLVK